MKLGIRFPDNDFHETMRAFMAVFIVPTFIEREKGHFVTHLTSAMVVELFNRHVPYLHRYINWCCRDKRYYPHNKPKLEENPLSTYFTITEQNVYWDNNTDAYLNGWEENNNGTFTWTNGVEIFIN